MNTNKVDRMEVRGVYCRGRRLEGEGREPCGVPSLLAPKTAAGQHGKGASIREERRRHRGLES